MNETIGSIAIENAGCPSIWFVLTKAINLDFLPSHIVSFFENSYIQKRNNVEQFLQAVEEIAQEQPVYREDGSGTDGTCDCIGLVIGAMMRCGHTKYPMHGSNYFARTQMSDLEGVEPEEVGMLVFKRRNPGENGYALPERYQAGGSGYNGDLGDYYHVGVVTGVSPIEITHCTSGGGVNGIKRDTTEREYRSWSVAGYLRDVNYEGGHEPMKEITGVVVSPDGNPVKLRRDPSTKNPYIAKVPAWSEVTVHESAGEWSTVSYNGMRGYMMSRFIEVEDEPAADEASGEAAAGGGLGADPAAGLDLEEVRQLIAEDHAVILDNQQVMMDMLRLICERFGISVYGVAAEENVEEEVNG